MSLNVNGIKDPFLGWQPLEGEKEITDSSIVNKICVSAIACDGCEQSAKAVLGNQYTGSLSDLGIKQTDEGIQLFTFKEKQEESSVMNLSLRLVDIFCLRDELKKDVEQVLSFIGNNINQWKLEKRNRFFCDSPVEVWYDRNCESVTVRIEEMLFDYDSLFIMNHPSFKLSDKDFNEMHDFIILNKVYYVDVARNSKKDVYLSTRSVAVHANHLRPFVRVNTAYERESSERADNQEGNSSGGIGARSRVYGGFSLPRSILFTQSNATIIHLNKKTERLDSIGQRIEGDILLGKGAVKIVTTAVWLENSNQEFASASINLETDRNACIEEFYWLNFFKSNPDFAQIKTVVKYRSIKNGALKARILMDKIEGPNLLTFLRDNKLTEEEKLRLAAELSRIISSLHYQDIIHRDIKPGNFMVIKDDAGKLFVKVIDLGSFKNTTDPKRIGGTLYYLAPEYSKAMDWHGNTLSQKEKGVALEAIDFKKADVWSLGVVLARIFELNLEEFLPEKKGTKDDLLKKKALLVDFEEPSSLDVIEHLVWQMLRVRPEDRISMSDVVSNLLENGWMIC